MTKLRDNMPTILIILVVSFVGMIVFQWGMDYLGLQTQSTTVLGAINGQTVYYSEFADLVRNAAESQKARTGKEPEDEDLRAIRDQVWDQLVTELLIGVEVDRLGIKATDDEILHWVRGDNPPEFLVQQFRDSAGAFNRAAYDQALADPRNSQVWVQVEEILRQQRKREKLQSLLFASIRVTEGEVRQRFIDQNIEMEAEYALFDPNRLIADSLVEIDERDLRRYYDEHQADYRVEATSKLKYVLVSDRPSKVDSQAVREDLLDLKRQALSGADFLDLLETYSEIPFSDAYFKHGELGFVKETAVFDADVGEIVGPVEDFDGYHLMKVLADRQGGKEFIRASHILLRFEAGVDSSDTWNLAGEIKNSLAAGEEFSSLAVIHSKDPVSAARGGDLGWFGKGRMIKEFEEAAFRAGIGQLVGPVKTQFGLHLIKVTGRSKREVKVADIFMSLKASPRTRNEAYESAADFSYLARRDGFEKEANFQDYPVRETAPFVKGRIIPGIGQNESLVTFAFENDLGDISEPVQIQGGYGVFMIAEKSDGGIQPFEDVTEAIRPRVLREKKMESVGQMAKDLHATLSPEDSLSVLRNAAPSARVQKTPPFKPNVSISGVGRDDVFLGVCLGLEAGETSKPFEGSRGYYIVRLLSKTEFDSTTYNALYDITKNQLLNQKKNRFLTEWIEGLKEKADIEDFRSRFYR